MSVLMLLLSVPIISAMALMVDYYGRTTATRDEFDFLSVLLRILGIGLAASGLAVIVSMFVIQNRVQPTATRIDELIVRAVAVLYACGAVVAGIFAESQGRWQATSSRTMSARGEAKAAIFRLICWVIVLSPLTLFAWWLLIVGPVIVVAILSCWGSLTRGRELSLLWHLAIAAENDLPFAKEIEASALISRGRRREALLGLEDRLRDGRSLPDSLEVGPRLLPRSSILAIRAAEGTPALADILRGCANAGIRELSILSGPGNLMTFQAYIINVFMFTLLIISFLMYWIVPKFKNIFEDFDVSLPPLSQAFFTGAERSSSLWLMVLPVATLPLIAILTPSIVSLLGWSNLNFPLLMRWFPQRDGPSLLRALAVSVDAGRPLPEAATELAEHHHREDIRNRLRRIGEALSQGETSWRALHREGFIRKCDSQALDAAARMGHLSLAMRSIADVMDYRQRLREAWWFEWQRPAMIITLAGFIGFVCVSMFLPLITLLSELAPGN